MVAIFFLYYNVLKWSVIIIRHDRTLNAEHAEGNLLQSILLVLKWEYAHK